MNLKNLLKRFMDQCHKFYSVKKSRIFSENWDEAIFWWCCIISNCSSLSENL